MARKKPDPPPAPTPLFEDLDLRPSLAPIPGSGTIRFLGHEQELSKEQKTFNRLTQRIQTLEAKIAQAERDHLELDQFYSQRYRPVLETLGASTLALALRIEETATRRRASKNVSRLLKRLMPAMLQDAFALVEPTPEALALHEKYARRSYQALCEEEEARQNAVFMDLLEDLGVEVPPDVRASAHDPKALEAFTDQLAQEFAGNAPRAPRARPLRKGRKQLEREQREQEKEQLKQRSLRDIYIALAKVLHPDTEPNPERKLQKEAFIKRTTVAYNEGNLVELLNLEMEWLATGAQQEVSSDKLHLYIEILKDQVKELERTSFQMANRYRETYGAFSRSIKAFRSDLAEAMEEAELDAARMKRFLARLEQDPDFLEPCLVSLLS